jgi:hypothetical protein
MTDQELKDLVASLAIKSVKLDEQLDKLREESLKTDEQMKRTDEKLEKMFAETDEQMKRTDAKAEKQMEDLRLKSGNDMVFSCSVYDILSKYGFGEGDFLIKEEYPLVKKACEYLAKQLGVVDGRWQAIISCDKYVLFDDLQEKKTIRYYDMAEKDRRRIEVALKQGKLHTIDVELL